MFSDYSLIKNHYMERENNVRYFDSLATHAIVYK
jgi:hypothetical protein